MDRQANSLGSIIRGNLRNHWMELHAVFLKTLEKISSWTSLTFKQKRTRSFFWGARGVWSSWGKSGIDRVSDIASVEALEFFWGGAWSSTARGVLERTFGYQKHHFRTQNKLLKVRWGWSGRIKYADSENSENFDIFSEDFPVSYVRKVFVLAPRGVVVPETLSESSYPLSFTVLRFRENMKFRWFFVKIPDFGKVSRYSLVRDVVFAGFCGSKDFTNTLRAVELETPP